MNSNLITEFAKILISEKPSDELGEAALLYSWLIDGWKVKAIDYLTDGSVTETQEEWYFSRVLEGKAGFNS